MHSNNPQNPYLAPTITTMKYVLGIDIGTGSVKAVAVNLQCQSFEVCQQHYSFSSPKPGYYEQDPEEIQNAPLGEEVRVSETTTTNLEYFMDLILGLGKRPGSDTFLSFFHSFIILF